MRNTIILLHVQHYCFYGVKLGNIDFFGRIYFAVTDSFANLYTNSENGVAVYIKSVLGMFLHKLKISNRKISQNAVSTIQILIKIVPQTSTLTWIRIVTCKTIVRIYTYVYDMWQLLLFLISKGYCQKPRKPILLHYIVALVHSCPQGSENHATILNLDCTAF